MPERAVTGALFRRGGAMRIRRVLASAPDGLPTPEVSRLAGFLNPGGCAEYLRRLEDAGIVRRAGTVRLPGQGGPPAVIWALADPGGEPRWAGAARCFSWDSRQRDGNGGYVCRRCAS